MTKDAFTMGRAKTIFINNNFFPFGWVHPNKVTTVVQVWHGQGAFKKFGLDIPQPEEVRKKEVGANRPLSYVTCSAETIRPIYMSAFGLPASKIITTGNPVSDYFFREENVGEAAVAAKRKAFDAKFPQCKGKYLVLYAPTFRDDPDEDASLLSHLDAAALKAAIEAGAGREAALLIRLHPNDSSGREQLQALTEEVDGVLDLTDYPDSNELSVLSDVLITDYSSICMNNALLHKPVVFYAYDLDSFEGDRDFYYPYEETVGGPVVKTMDDLCRVFEKQDFRTDRLEAFRELHFGVFDGGAAKAMLEQVL
ncbi:MAG: CDP-glycerol glycerophosphotransferase family protein, partial [Eubacteriales bacterium]